MSMTRELFALEGRIKRLQNMSEASVNEFTLAFIIEDRPEWTKKDAPAKERHSK
jgi:hypothetical protein